jgi:hypothetical protein
MISNAPSEDRTRQAEAIDPPRVDARVFRQGWRIRTRLDALHIAGLISAGEWQTGHDFRAACDRVRGVGERAAPDIRAGSGGRPDGAHGAMLSMVATQSRLNAVEAQLGPLFSRLCVWCCVHDVSWAHLGRVVHVDAKTARSYTVMALHRLGFVWIATAVPAQGWQDGAGAFAAPSRDGDATRRLGGLQAAAIR